MAVAAEALEAAVAAGAAGAAGAVAAGAATGNFAAFDLPCLIIGFFFVSVFAVS